MGVSTAHKHVSEQTEASTTWVVVHKLNTLSPIIDVMVNTGNGLQKILPLDVEVIDASTVRVTFSSARTGKVTVA